MRRTTVPSSVEVLVEMGYEVVAEWSRRAEVPPAVGTVWMAVCVEGENVEHVPQLEVRNEIESSLGYAAGGLVEEPVSFWVMAEIDAERTDGVRDRGQTGDRDVQNHQPPRAPVTWRP